MSTSQTPFVRWLRELGTEDIALAGGKNASLGELMKLDGIQVPNGFAITTEAFRRFLEPMKEEIDKRIGKLKADGVLA